MTPTCPSSTQNILFCINSLAGSALYASGVQSLFTQIDRSLRKKTGSMFDRQLRGANRVVTLGGKVALQLATNGR